MQVSSGVVSTTEAPHFRGEIATPMLDERLLAAVQAARVSVRAQQGLAPPGGSRVPRRAMQSHPTEGRASGA